MTAGPTLGVDRPLHQALPMGLSPVACRAPAFTWPGPDRPALAAPLQASCAPLRCQLMFVHTCHSVPHPESHPWEAWAQTLA